MVKNLTVEAKVDFEIDYEKNKFNPNTL